MIRFIIAVFLLGSCKKEVSQACGRVVAKPVLLNIHGHHLDVGYGTHIDRIKVNLPTWTQYQVGDTFCE